MATANKFTNVFSGFISTTLGLVSVFPKETARKDGKHNMSQKCPGQDISETLCVEVNWFDT